MKDKIIQILKDYEVAFDEINAVDPNTYEDIANEIIKLFE